MYPEDRVLVGVMPNPRDLEFARNNYWYRVPVKRAAQGIHAEYVAFYFTGKFPEAQRYGIHYYTRRTGHELVRRVDLLPDEPAHPRAEEKYYKIQLAPLKEKQPPIISLRWRRITFIHTTWDRFVNAHEINDLYSTDDKFVDRVYHALKRQGIQPERQVEIREGQQSYTVDMLIPCKDGAVLLSSEDKRPTKALALKGNEETDLQIIANEIEQRGGPLLVDLPV